MTEQVAPSRTLQAPSPAAGTLRPRLPQLSVEPPRAGWLAVLAKDVADAFEARRLLVLLPFAMIAGLIAYAMLPSEPSVPTLAGIGLCLILLATMVRARFRLQRVAIVAAAFWLGLCLLPVHGHLWGSTMLARAVYGPFEAVVDEVISETEDSRRLIVSQIVSFDPARSVDIRRARLVMPAQPSVEPGDRIRADLRLAPVPGPILPGAFDSQFHAHFAGIGAYGNVTGGIEVVETGDTLNPVRLIDGLRRTIGQRIDAVLDGAPAAIAWAMIVGDQSNITDETREVMAGSGLAHIYSISGLHLSIVAGGVFFIVRALFAAIHGLTGPLPAKKIGAVAGVAAAAGYLLLAGGTGNIPAFRSTLMLVLIFGAVLAGRRALTMRNVALAALVIILIDPANVFRASFQLSFAAVVALIGVYELPRKSHDGEQGLVGRVFGAVWATALTSFIAGFATLLFAAYHFQQTAPLGIVGNVLALPFLTFLIMPFGVLSVLAMPLGIEQPFLLVMGWGIARMMDIAVFVSDWSRHLETNPLITQAALIVALATLAWFAFLRTRWRFAGPLLALPLLLAFGFDQRPDILIADTTQAVAIREGQGMGLLAGRTGSFATDVWSEHYASPIAPSLARARCDSLGCIYSGENFTLALVRNRDAFAEDCARNALVVTRLSAPASCAQSAQTIDFLDLTQKGVHWLRWDQGQSRFDIRTAIGTLDRPWRIAPP